MARQLSPDDVSVEGFIFCFFILFLVGFAFAIYGFVRFLMDVSRSARSAQQPVAAREADETAERQASSARLLLNKLLASGDISRSQYDEFRNLLERRFPDVMTLPSRMSGPQDFPETKFDVTGEPPVADDVLVIADLVETSTGPETFIEAREIEAGAAFARSGEAIQSALTPVLSPAAPVAFSTPARTEPVAPWDVPDQPPRERRSMQELLAGFMLEKNIRWGELASGILIVGSAVGLVVSLRNELQQTIPYFPALMFMLITAAIHGAGIYTLKKWKLRNTSRGVLIIGLLLVPLNFLAACILTGSGAEQRELTDPIYWLAIAVGIGGFAAMTWFSSKSLLRHRYWPMLIAVLGSSAWTLAINRAVTAGQSSLLTMAWAAPICLAFLTGVSTAVKGQWHRVRWSDRAVSRLWLFVGIGVFAFLCAISLILIRWPDRLWAAVALTPAFSLMSLTAGWLGALIMQGANAERQAMLRMTGTAIFVLGLILFAGSLLTSFANPIVLVGNASVAACLLFGISTNRKLPAAWPAVWAAMALAVLAAASVSLGVLPFDRAPHLDEIKSAVFSARSGIILLLTGLGAAGLQQLFGRAVFPANQFRVFRDLGLASASVIGCVGCGLALVASFVNPENRFDMMTASCLLAMMAMVALAWAVWKEKLVWLPYVAGALLLACLSHALLWNSFIGARLVLWTRGSDARGSLLFGTQGILLAACGAIVRFRARKTALAEASLAQHVIGFSGFAMVALICGFLPILWLVETGLATRIAIALAVGWFFVAWSLAGLKTAETFSKIGFAAATWLIVVVAVLEWSLRSGWLQSPWQYALWQLYGAAGWCLAWMIPGSYLGKTRWFGWLIDYSPRLDQVALPTLSFGLVAIVLASLIPGVWTEMQSDPTERATSIFAELAVNKPLLIQATAILGVVCLSGALLQPSLAKGIALANIWLIAWALGASDFGDAKSIGSALRWLLPIGGAVLALLMSLRRWYAPIWTVSRNALRLPGASSLSFVQRQRVINWSLLVGVGTVMLISTITISIVLLQGKEALGGPVPNSWFGVLRKDVSFGVPVAIIVGTFLFYAITERRSWLAIAGSGVFQYVVILSVVLLCISPHPQLASEWFINILQAVSVGMTFYGAAWFVFRQRVGDSRFFPSPWPTHIQLHTLLNSVLVGSLVVLILQRFFLFPTQGAGWINATGGPLGYAALAVLAGLIFVVWREQWKSHRIWISGALGLGVTALLASSVDRWTSSTPWLAFDTILCGSLIVASVQAGLGCWPHVKANPVAARETNGTAIQSPVIQSRGGLPAMCSGALTVLFATRGAVTDISYFWWFLLPILILIGIANAYGAASRRAHVSVVAAGLTFLAAVLIGMVDPLQWVNGRITNWLNLQFSCLLALSIIWTSVYVYHRRIARNPIGQRFVLLPNIVTCAAVVWIWIGCLIGCFTESVLGWPIMSTTLGLIAIGVCAAMLTINLWSDAARLRVIGIWIWMLAVAALTVGMLVDATTSKIGWWCTACASVSAFWGIGWFYRRSLVEIATDWKIARRESLRQEIESQIPLFDAVTTGCLFPFVMALLFFADLRTPRVLAAMTPIILAFGVAPFADSSRRSIQLMTLSLVTLGAVFLAWSNLAPSEMRDDPLHLPARSLVALAAAMFIYGAALPRYLDSSSGWLRTFREITVATCAAALLSFVAVIFIEAPRYQTDIGCGTPLTTAAAISIVVICMIAGLISIAILPKHDPLSLPLSGRKGYVYAAQVVAVLLITHTYVSMPWLFQIGLKQYWPYIALAVAFGGVAISRLLEHRKLEVLGQPLFHTTAVLPLVAALGIWAIDSKADPSLVMLLAGFVYLSISISRQSVLWGAAAVVFGNIALWLFYGKFDAIGFARHPQLWLIPPAISVLIAAQINRRKFSAGQLASLRYVCVAAIYVSSTSEIFLQGFGSHLWPPMILSLLSVAGIMLGIMFHVRAYLYLGSLFLLMSVLSMVAHAQQRLQHTWPWWAFGVGLGVAILVMFGLFEKKRNEMKHIAGALREWEW